VKGPWGRSKPVHCRPVLPRLKVHGLGRADAEHDPQNFHVGHPLSQRWIEASAALLDSSKVEASRVGDRLECDRWESGR